MTVGKIAEIYLITYLIVIQNFPVGIHTFILLLVAVLQFTLVNPTIPSHTPDATVMQHNGTVTNNLLF
jgi:hypothetical protein